jgi:outer membrane immunogenic protein
MAHRLSAVLIGGIAVVALTQIASAADLPRKAPAYSPPPPPLAYNWTGFYVGGNVGGAWSTTDWTFFNGANFEAFGQDASSWMGGGQIGYLYQFAPNWVTGIEASWSGTDLKDTSISVINADRSRQSKITDLLLVTARLGYASNNWLGYVKGGYANSNIDFNTWVTSSGLQTTTSSGRDGGWTVGGGVEYGFTPYISLGVEYNFARINIGDRNQSVSPGFLTPETVTAAHVDISTVWARLNFRFAPFVGKY